MATFSIRKGRNIPLRGSAVQELKNLSVPKRVAIQPLDLRGFKARLLVKEGDQVKVGTPVLENKNALEVKVVSPVSGKVVAVERGEKRLLLRVIIESDGRQEAIGFNRYNKEGISALSREQVIEHLLVGGVWPFLRQRPFAKIADSKALPKAIFVTAMNTEPLALDPDFILRDKQAQFQTGLDILAKLTNGKVYLNFSPQAKSDALTNAQGVEKSIFAGPHPAGNVSTHIHNLHPIRKGDVVWYVNALDVLRVAKLFTEGVFDADQYVALTGEGLTQRAYVKTIQGAPLADLIGEDFKANIRYISGSVLSGRNVGATGFLCFYDSQVTAIPEGGERKFLGWLVPGFKTFSFSKTYASALIPQKEVTLTADKHGSDRAIVLNHIYDDLNALDILTYFLLRAVIAGEIEEMEKLGILECDEEDFALATFACPSKTDVGGIIRQGLDMIEKEG